MTRKKKGGEKTTTRSLPASASFRLRNRIHLFIALLLRVAPLAAVWRFPRAGASIGLLRRSLPLGFFRLLNLLPLIVPFLLVFSALYLGLVFVPIALEIAQATRKVSDTSLETHAFNLRTNPIGGAGPGSSEKYSCFKQSSAVGRSSGLYCNNLAIKSMADDGI